MRAPLRTTGSLLAALCLAAAALTPVADAAPQDRRSLEELLAEERAAAAAQVEALRPRVETLLSSLGGLGGAKVGDPKVRKIVDELGGLGSPGAVLLVEVLDPGDRATRDKLFVAGHVTAALERMPTAAITGRLLTMTTEGSARGRLSAVRILGATGDPRRVGAHLAGLYRDDPALRRASLEALCILGGAEADGVLAQLLESSGDAAAEELGAALAALTEALERGRATNPTTVAFLHGILQSGSAPGLVTELLAHCRALGPERIDEQAARLLVGLAADRMVERPDRVRLLDALPGLQLEWDRKLGDLLERQGKSSFAELRQATLVCLTRYGDKRAKKDLLEPYDEAIKREKREPKPLQDRAAVLIRIRDLDGAIADYKKAIKLADDQNLSPYATNDARIGLAKAHCLAGDLRGASKALEDSALSTVQLRNLANDPDFADLVASDRYRGVLRLRN